MCIIDGNWGNWTTWSTCQSNCTKLRSRNCDKPAPANGGKSCSGSGQESESCTDDKCIIDGNWGNWTSWSSCQSNCKKSRSRNCENPAPQNEGKPCPGSSQESESCTGEKCVVDGIWGNWTSWSSCQSNCTKSRSRSCDDPAPENGGKPCAGSGQDSESCTGNKCVVDGNWGGWTSWASCESNCLKSRSRKCD